MRRRSRGGAWGAAASLVVLGSSCGEVRLVDPTVAGIPVAGVVVDVGIASGSAGTRLEFQGYVYGYEARGRDMLLRYLDAGSVAVGGHEAEREYVRTGEPVYRARVSGVAARPETEIRIGGSDAVAGCTFEVDVPVAQAPAAGAVVRRDRELAIPLVAGPKLLVASRIRARVLVADNTVGTFWIDLIPQQGVLVVPVDFLARLRAGTRELTVRIDMERTTGSSNACAPSIAARSWYEHRVVVTFQ